MLPLRNPPDDARFEGLADPHILAKILHVLADGYDMQSTFARQMLMQNGRQKEAMNKLMDWIMEYVTVIPTEVRVGFTDIAQEMVLILGDQSESLTNCAVSVAQINVDILEVIKHGTTNTEA